VLSSVELRHTADSKHAVGRVNVGFGPDRPMSTLITGKQPARGPEKAAQRPRKSPHSIRIIAALHGRFWPLTGLLTGPYRYLLSL
jgi:hypothetical protein